MYLLDWAKEYADIWLNIISGCVCVHVLEEISFELVKWVKQNVRFMTGHHSTHWGPKRTEESIVFLTIWAAASVFSYPCSIGAPGSQSVGFTLEFIFNHYIEVYLE